MRKCIWPGVAALSMLMFSALASADSLSEQRQRYQDVKSAWDANNMAEVERLMPSLRDYPLYPYLEYRELTQDMSLLTAGQVKNFTDTHPNLPSAASLKNKFISELAKRNDWQGLVSYSTTVPKPVSAKCDYYYASWQTGNRQVALDGAKSVWLAGNSLPSSCDKLFDVWDQSGGLTPERVLERISLALKNGNTSLVSYLAKRLPASYQTISNGLINLQKNPASVVTFAQLSPTDFTRQATISAFSAYARKSPDAARADLNSVARAQKMNDSERQQLKDAVAWQYMGSDVTDEQAAWRDEVIQETDSVTLRERRVRLALSNADDRDLDRWLTRLPADAQQKEEWQYWHAVLLEKGGNKAAADAILEKITQGRGFYPMVAAQRLGKPYVMMINAADKPDNSISNLPEIQRIRELLYWQMEGLARTEWLNLVDSQTPARKAQLARYALEQGWADLSVQATINGKLWDHLEERFPLAWQSEFDEFTQNKNISKSYAMAIARQESAWNPQARSPVGATGLMQLMPATATQTVRDNGITDYSNSTQLVNPRKNIEIGTAYLNGVYNQFGQNRILASAAYNAGPNRVTRWLSNSGGRLDAVAFVETIPFAETRGYVKNVLAFDVFYQNFLKGQRPADVLTPSEQSMRY